MSYIFSTICMVSGIGVNYENDSYWVGIRVVVVCFMMQDRTSKIGMVSLYILFLVVCHVNFWCRMVFRENIMLERNYTAIRIGIYIGYGSRFGWRLVSYFLSREFLSDGSKFWFWRTISPDQLKLLIRYEVYQTTILVIICSCGCERTYTVIVFNESVHCRFVIASQSKVFFNTYT
jgi:hypothetical protein